MKIKKARGRKRRALLKGTSHLFIKDGEAELLNDSLYDLRDQLEESKKKGG